MKTSKTTISGGDRATGTFPKKTAERRLCEAPALRELVVSFPADGNNWSEEALRKWEDLVLERAKGRRILSAQLSTHVGKSTCRQQPALEEKV